MSKNNECEMPEFALLVAADDDGITCHLDGNKMEHYLLFITLAEYLSIRGELIDCITLMTNVLIRKAKDKGYNKSETVRALNKVIESDELAPYMGSFGVSNPVGVPKAVKDGGESVADLDSIIGNIKNTIDILRQLVSRDVKEEKQVIIPMTVGGNARLKS